MDPPTSSHDAPRRSRTRLWLTLLFAAGGAAIGAVMATSAADAGHGPVPADGVACSPMALCLYCWVGLSVYWSLAARGVSAARAAESSRSRALLKSLLETRPIFHHLVTDNVKGHIFGCWLALYLVVTLRKRVEALNLKVEWNDLLRDLSQVRAIELNLEGQRYLLRTELPGTAHVAFRAAGVKPPLLAQPLSASGGPGAVMQA